MRQILIQKRESNTHDKPLNDHLSVTNLDEN